MGLWRKLSPSRLLNCLLALLLLLLLLAAVRHRVPESTSVTEPSHAGGIEDLPVERMPQTEQHKVSYRSGDLQWMQTATTKSRPNVVADTHVRKSTGIGASTTLHPDLLKAQERVRHVHLFKPFVTKQEWSIMLHLLHSIDRVFRLHSVTYIIYGGTLLGSHRHHGLVPWDDDIDLLVNKTDRGRLPQMLAAAAPDLILQQAGGHDKIYHGSLSRRTSKYAWRWPYLDVSFFAENSTHLWDHMATYSHWFVYPKWLVLPTHVRPFEHLWLPAPRDTLAFLQMTYGRTGTCLTSAYSHMIENGMSSGRQPCLKLNGFVPFVHRQPCLARDQANRTADCVNETLRLGDTPLRPPVTVAEPSFAVNEPFSLRLVDGFTQPPHYPSMSDSDL